MGPSPEELAYIASFQARLRKQRVARGYSQEELAKLLGLKKTTYKHYETREGSSFPLYLLPQLSVALQRPIEFWVYGDDRPVRRLGIVR